MKVASTAALLALITATVLATAGGALADLHVARRDPVGLLTLVMLFSWPAVVPSAIVAGYLAWAYVTPDTAGWTLRHWVVTDAGLGMLTGAVAMPLWLVVMSVWRGGLSGMSDVLAANTVIGAIGGAGTGAVVGAYCWWASRAAAISPSPSASPHTPSATP